MKATAPVGLVPYGIGVKSPQVQSLVDRPPDNNAASQS